MFNIASGVILGVLIVRMMLVRPLVALALGGLLAFVALLRAGLGMLGGLVLVALALFWGAFAVELLRIHWQDRRTRAPR